MIRKYNPEDVQVTVGDILIEGYANGCLEIDFDSLELVKEKPKFIFMYPWSF